jgi:hypothetical protein
MVFTIAVYGKRDVFHFKVGEVAGGESVSLSN